MENNKVSKVRTSFLKKGFGRRESTLFLVALIILIAFGLRWLWIPTKDTVTHDEAISYLGATCHEGSYSTIENSTVPVKASDWKQHLKVDEKLCFTQIRNDLVTFSRHPPIYFWLLHIWALLVGVQTWTGPSLNVYIALITLALLYAFAKDVLNSRKDGLLVSVTYGLSIAVIGISFVARYHDLLTLVVLILVWISFKLTEPDRSNHTTLLVALIVITFIGSLVHFFFLLALSAVLVFSFLRLAKLDPKRWFKIVAALVIGFLLARIVYPFEVVIFPNVDLNNATPTLEEVGQRIIVVLFTFYQFAPLLLMTLIALSVAVWWFIRRKQISYLKRRDVLGRNGIFVLFYLFWFGFGIITLYLANVLPRHVMGETRLGMVWPFLAFLPVFVLRLFNYRGTILLYFILTPIIFVAVFVSRNFNDTDADPGSILEGSPLIVIDNSARGMSSQILWYTPDDANVIVGNQEFLLENADLWVDALKESTLYVSDISYASTEEGRQEMLSLMERAGFDPVTIGRLPTQKPPMGAVVYELHISE